MARWRPRVERFARAIIAAVLGSACNSTPTRAVAPREQERRNDLDDAHSHQHEHGTHGDGVLRMHAFADAAAHSNAFDDPRRDAWQRPDEVLRALELTPGMTVADVGAGTGYFAVRLARAVPNGKVIATDLATDMVRHLSERARREQLPNLHAVPATPTGSGLPVASVDRILLVHVWHHLAGRGGYARDLSAALRPSGKLLVVDFQVMARRGPPAQLRVAPAAVIADLAAAGLVARLSPLTLPDQYIVEAHRPNVSEQRD